MRQPCELKSILRPTYVGPTVDNRGLHSLRMWDEKYS